MNKAYFIVPLIGLLVFGGYWYSFTIENDKILEAKHQAEIHARDEKARQDQINREKAVKDAVASSEKRKAEREAKLAKEKKDKEDREAAVEYRNKLRGDQYKLDSQSQRLAKDIVSMKEEVSKIQENVDRLNKERDHLKILVKETEGNSKSLQTVSEKIEKADDSIRRVYKELAGLRAKSS
jgi:colicin import membrane protein